jgi:hypothetical protein
VNLEWTKIFDLKARYLFAVWLFGSLLLLSPLSISSKFGFASIVDSYRGWIGLSTIGFFTLWTVQLFSGYREARQKRKVELAEIAKRDEEDLRVRDKQSKMREEVLRSVSTLSKNELFLLAYAVDQNQQTIFASRANRFALALVAKHLLIPAPTGNIVQYPYTIPNFVWDYLQQHNHELFDSDVFPEYEEWKAIYHGGYDLLSKTIFGDL